MNELEDAQRIAKAYTTSHDLTVDDISVQAQGKVKQAKRAKPAKRSSETLTIKEETVANGIAAEKKAKKVAEKVATEPFTPAHSAADRLAAAIRERNERQWLFCSQDRDVEIALTRAADKENRMNRATRNAMAQATPQPKQKRATQLEMASQHVAEIQNKLTTATERRDGTAAHISKITSERPHADAERKGVIDGALDILRGELLKESNDVNNLKDDLRMAQNKLASIHTPRGNPVEEYENAKTLYEAGKIGSGKLADYREAARVAIWRGEVKR